MPVRGSTICEYRRPLISTNCSVSPEVESATCLRKSCGDKGCRIHLHCAARSSSRPCPAVVHSQQIAIGRHVGTRDAIGLEHGHRLIHSVALAMPPRSSCRLAAQGDRSVDGIKRQLLIAYTFLGRLQFLNRRHLAALAGLTPKTHAGPSSHIKGTARIPRKCLGAL